MLRLVGRRLLATIPTLFGVLVVAFLLLNVVPGDPVAEMVGERADSATIARLRAELHLDDPVPVQFGHYLWGVVRGDLGRSYITQRPVLGDLAERFPKTLKLAGAAMLLAVNLTGYAILLYPDFPKRLGGGKKPHALVILSEAYPEHSGLPLSKDGRVIGPVVLLLETSTAVAVTGYDITRFEQQGIRHNVSAVSIERKHISSLVYLKPSREAK